MKYNTCEIPGRENYSKSPNIEFPFNLVPHLHPSHITHPSLETKIKLSRSSFH